MPGRRASQSFACLENNVTRTIHVHRRYLRRLADRSISGEAADRACIGWDTHHTCAMPSPLCRCHRSCASGPSNHSCEIAPLQMFSSTNQTICSLAKLPTEHVSAGKTHHDMRRARAMADATVIVKSCPLTHACAIVPCNCLTAALERNISPRQQEVARLIALATTSL